MTSGTRMYWVHALTPLHVGAGRGVGYIDLPIMREKVTNLPLVPGSAIKGVLRDEAESRIGRDPQIASLLLPAFGKTGDEHANSGSLVFTDARLICLPVRSFYGTFAWCTSPMILMRLHRDLESGGIRSNARPPAGLRSPNSVHVPQGVNSVIHDEQRRVFLEDLDLAAESCPTAAGWAEELGNWLFDSAAWANTFRERFAVLPDDVFNFLCESGTEVTARVRIDDDKKTVASGALWYEESLPAETILAGLVWCDRVFGRSNGADQTITEDDLLREFCSGQQSLQIGGKATVGKGRVRCLFSGNGSATKEGVR